MKASFLGAVFWWITDPAGQYVSEDGKTISGSYQMPDLGTDANLIYRWTLQASP